ncbi:DMT family transporter [Granulosicoccus sp.]|nr:DMT family transporter [Granulosicoccus sp.]MDB4223648.1 DMT family transporter [Granulosicoccus sp.]
MNKPISPHSNARLGSGMMAIAMLSIPMVDGLAKYLSADFSPLFISWARYAIASCIIVPIALARFGRTILPSSQLSAHFFRTLCLVTAMTLYFLALSQIPMATATSAFFISPIMATALAVLIAKEKFTVVKSISLVLGLCGMLLIAKPGMSFEPGILLAVAAGVAFAVYLVATRLASQNTDPIKTLTFQCLVGSLLLLPQALWTWKLPTPEYYVFFAILGVISVSSHLLSITAFRYAQTSVLAPLVYLELVGAVVIGYFVFEDVPSLLIMAGAALIIIGGLLVTVYSND